MYSDSRHMYSPWSMWGMASIRMPSTCCRAATGCTLQLQKCQARDGLQREVPWDPWDPWDLVHEKDRGSRGSADKQDMGGVKHLNPGSPWITPPIVRHQAAQAESLWDRGGGAALLRCCGAAVLDMLSKIRSDPWIPWSWLSIPGNLRSLQVDYRGDEVSVENFLRLLTGTARCQQIEKNSMVQEVSPWIYTYLYSTFLGNKPPQSDLD